MKDLTRLYDRLTPHERFAAFEAAVARMDETEIEALENTCPQKTYRLPDGEYADMKTGLFKAWVQMQLRSSELIKAMAVMALVISNNKGEKARVEKARALLVAHRGLEIAWERFVEHIGLNKDVGATNLDSLGDKADGFIIDAIWLLGIDSDYEPSEEAIEREFEMLMSCWYQE